MIKPHLIIDEHVKELVQLIHLARRENIIDETQILGLRQKTISLLENSEFAAMAHAIIATTYSLLEDLDGMLEHYQKALALKPKDPMLNYNYAAELLACYEVNKAVEQFKKTLQFASSEEMLISILENFIKLIRIDEAKSVVNKLTQITTGKNTRILYYQNVISQYEDLPKDTLKIIQKLIYHVYTLFMHKYPKNITILSRIDKEDKSFVYKFIDSVSPLETVWEFDDELMQIFIQFEEDNQIFLPFFTLMYEKAS